MDGLGVLKVQTITNSVDPDQTALFSVCIKGSLGVRDSKKLLWDFQKSMPGSLDSQLLKIFSHL